MSKIDIEKILQQSEANFTKQPPADAWQPIADALHQKKKRRVGFFLLFGSLALGITIWSIYNFSNTKKASIAQTVNAEKNTQTVANTYRKDSVAQRITAKKELSITNEIATRSSVNNNLVESSKSKVGVYNNAIQGNENNVVANTTKKTNRKITIKKRKLIAVNNIAEVTLENDIAGNDLIEEKNVFVAVPTEQIEVQNTKSMQDTAVVNNVALKNDTAVKDNTNERTATKEKTEKTKNNKWQQLLQFSVGQSYVNKNSLISSSEKSASSFQPSALSGGSNNRIIDSFPSIYTNGWYISTAFLLEKTGKKKTKLQIGGGLNFIRFNTKAFKTIGSNILLENNSLINDSTAVGNSVYAARRSALLDVGYNKVQNSLLQVGFLVGIKQPLFSFKKSNTLFVQSQLMPLFNIHQNIQWYNESTFRYFTSKNIITTFSVQQNISLLWEFKTKQSSWSIGPVYQFGWNKLNKTINGLQNMTMGSFGLQVQYLLKK